MRLQTSLGAVTKLLRDREKEARLAGRIQDDLKLQLGVLTDLINEILDQRTTRSGLFKQIGGTFCGGGAMSLLDRLQEQDDVFRDLLRFADSEVLVAQASALEEMAGGAAAKNISHDAIRVFWREQFKNEMSLSLSAFLDGLGKYEEALSALAQDKFSVVLGALRSRLDSNHDNVITLPELNRFVEATKAHGDGNTDFFNVLVAALIQGPLRHTLVGGQPAIVRCFDILNGNLLATGDVDGVVRVWSVTDVGLAHVTTITVTNGRDPIACVHFVFGPLDQPRRLLASAGSSVYLLNPFTGAFICSFNVQGRDTVKVMATEGRRLFTANGVVGGARSWLQMKFDEPYVTEGLLGNSNRNYETIQVLGNGKHVALLEPTKWPQVFDYTKGTTVICSGLEGANTICTDVNTHELCVGGGKWEYEVVDPENPVSRKSVMPVYLQPSFLVPYHNTAFQHIQVTKDGMIHFGSHNTTRGGPYRPTWITALPTNVVVPMKHLRCSNAYEGICTLSWTYGNEGASGMTVFRAPADVNVQSVIPTVIVSSVGNLCHQPAALDNVPPHLKRPYLAAITIPNASTTRDVPHVSHSDTAFVSVQCENTLHVWSSNMELVGQVTLPNLDGTVTTLTTDADDIFIGTTAGQLCRIRIPRRAAVAGHSELTPAARRELHRAEIRNVLQCFIRDAATDVRECQKTNRWKYASMNGGVLVQARMARLPKPARDLCGSLAKFFATTPAITVDASSADKLVEVINRLDENAIPLDGTTPGLLLSNTNAEVLCSSASWQSIQETRLFSFPPTCLTCNAPHGDRLEDRWFGHCSNCLPRAFDRGVCRSCVQRRVMLGSSFCEPCFHTNKARGHLSAYHVLCVTPDTIVVAAQSEAQASVDTFRGVLLLLDRVSLKELCRLDNAYCRGHNNLVRVPQFDSVAGAPVFATAYSHCGVGFFTCKRNQPLSRQQIGTYTLKWQIDSIVLQPSDNGESDKAAITLHLRTLSSSSTPLSRCVSLELTRGVEGECTLTATDQKLSHTEFMPLLALPGAFFAGRTAGDIAMMMRSSTGFSLVGTLHGHDFGSPSTFLLHPVSGSLITVYSDASFAVWPRDLFKPRSLNNTGHSRGPRNAWLLKSTDGDVRAVIGHGYEYRPMADQESGWLSLTSGVNAAEQLLISDQPLQVRHRYDTNEVYRVHFDSGSQKLIAARQTRATDEIFDVELATHHRTPASFLIACDRVSSGQSQLLEFVDFNPKTPMSPKPDATYVVRLHILSVTTPGTVTLKVGDSDISHPVQVSQPGTVILTLTKPPIEAAGKTTITTTGSLAFALDSANSGDYGPMLVRTRAGSDSLTTRESTADAWSMPFEARRHGS